MLFGFRNGNGGRSHSKAFNREAREGDAKDAKKTGRDPATNPH
jgi:hypothetical protein